MEEGEKENKMRFMTELEFVQLLSNPNLGQNKFLEDQTFLNYLDYLRYWKKPEYVKYIIYPHCLYFLDQLVESEKFREECKKKEFTDFIAKQQGLHWQFYRRNRELDSATELTK